MGLCRLGHNAAVTLRQPSLGPVFGDIQGGGTGGGRAQVWPMEDINHFTGDAHAVSASHNLLSAFVDNHLFQGNALKLDRQRIRWPRTLGVSDQALRDIVLNAEAGPRPGSLSSPRHRRLWRCWHWPWISVIYASASVEFSSA